MEHEILKRKLRAGIVGGGIGSFIGPIHLVAATLDHQAEIVAGAMSSNEDKAERSAQNWFLRRSYDDYRQMAQAEADLADADGIDFVIIATPNHLHFDVARTFLQRGISVICDKPMTFNLEEAQELVKIVEESAVVFALTHSYTGYPAVRHAQHLVRMGELGEIRKVLVEYNQDWMMEPIEKAGQKQASWRTDPSKSGISGCVGDIGTHGENLLEFITGLNIKSLCADLTTFVKGRALEDDANILLRLENGGKGVLTCSQIATGEGNNLTIRIYGSKAAIEWHQEAPSGLIFKQFGKPHQILQAGYPYMSDPARESTRLPAGHPEGFFEAFANIYRAVMNDIRRQATGQNLQGGYPTVYDGLRGLQFVTKVIESSRRGGVWTELNTTKHR
jgi:predicted dehydrogenase